MSKVPRSVIFLSICVLAVVVSGITVAAVQDSGQATIKTSENSTNYLQPSDTTRKGYDEVSINVAGAVDSSAQELHAETDIRSFRRLMRLNPGEERQHRLANERLRVLETEYQDLDDYQQALFEAYSGGELSGVELSHEMVRLRTAIETRQTLRKQLERYADPSNEFLEEFNSLEQSLATRQPVTDRLEAAMAGSQNPALLYAESSADALVLATITNDTYLRQATIRSERDLGSDDQFLDLWRDATDRTETLYPWTFNSDNIRGLDPFNLQRFSQVYAVRAEHTQGELTVYLDGATRSVFHENQVKPLGLQPVTRTVTNESGRLTVTVELTNSAGPMYVIVTNQAGVPVEDVPVTVEGAPIGLTDTDGELWAVQPSGSFQINASAEDGSSGSVRVAD